MLRVRSPVSAINGATNQSVMEWYCCLLSTALYCFVLDAPLRLHCARRIISDLYIYSHAVIRFGAVKYKGELQRFRAPLICMIRKRFYMTETL
jgi:hypothetical protein